MDTSKEYINMCREAGEIQTKPYFPSGLKPLRQNGIYFDNEGSFWVVNQQSQRWLPRQDQLQEMLVYREDLMVKHIMREKYSPEEYTPITRLRSFVEFAFRMSALSYGRGCICDGYTIEMESPYDFESLEQLWLAFIMQELYKKQWDGKKWTLEKNLSKV